MGWKRRLEGEAIARGGGALLTGLLHTVRTEVIHGAHVQQLLFEQRQPAILVLWHGRLLLPAFHFRKEGLATLISRNRDGDHISRVVEGWGFRVVRGSSSRGGTAALRQIVRVVEEGYSVALTPDGPRGPRQKMKPGALQAARLAGVPIVPGSAGAVRAGYFGRWDRFLVPAPFTWAPIAIGDPIEIPADTDDAELDAYGAGIETRLNELTGIVDEAARARRG